MQKIALKGNTDAVQEETKKKTGLLGRIQVSSNYDTIYSSFLTFLKKAGAERGGILFPSVENGSELIFSFGFDITTSRRFSPDPDFLCTLLTDQSDWTVLSDQMLQPLSSCFSSRERSAIQNLYIHIIDILNTRAFIVLARSTLDISRQPINLNATEPQLTALTRLLSEKKSVAEALLSVETVIQSQNSIKDRAKSAFASEKKATLVYISLSRLFPDIDVLMTDSSVSSMYNAIVHTITRKAGMSNIVYAGNPPFIRVVLFTAQTVDPLLYFHQLLMPIRQIFGTFRASAIQITCEGITDSVQEILNFLNGVE